MNAKRMKLSDTAAPKGVAKRMPAKRDNRNHKKNVDVLDSHADRGVYVPPQRNTNRKVLSDANASFNATSSGEVSASPMARSTSSGTKHYEDYHSGAHAEMEPGLELDGNGEIEFRTGSTPAGLFSPGEGESWDIPYTPEHISDEDLDSQWAASEAQIDTAEPRVAADAQLDTPEPRALHDLFSPDAPHGSMDKKVVTHYRTHPWVSNYGDNVPEWAQEDLEDNGSGRPPGLYNGPMVTCEVVKTFVPSYILQMPKKVRALIFGFMLYPHGKAKAPRPLFSHLSSWRHHPPALLQTCQQVRKEASLIYYGNMIVTGSSPDPATSLRNLLPWLQTLDPVTRAMLGKIRLPFDAWDHVDKHKDQQIRLRLRQFREVGIEIKRGRFELIVMPQDVTRSMGGDLTDDE